MKGDGKQGQMLVCLETRQSDPEKNVSLTLDEIYDKLNLTRQKSVFTQFHSFIIDFFLQLQKKFKISSSWLSSQTVHSRQILLICHLKSLSFRRESFQYFLVLH
jgi:hypothetical protein